MTAFESHRVVSSNNTTSEFVILSLISTGGSGCNEGGLLSCFAEDAIPTIEQIHLYIHIKSGLIEVSIQNFGPTMSI